MSLRQSKEEGPTVKDRNESPRNSSDEEYDSFAFKRNENLQMKRSMTMDVGQIDARNSLPDTGLLRLWQILGDRRRGVPPIIPISKSSWWAGVKSGKYPKPVKLSARCTCWYVEDIRKLIGRMEKP